MELQELLPYGFARQLEKGRELRDRRGAALLQRNENRAAAFGELIDFDDGVVPLRLKGLTRATA
jgi:hypothetical protein